MQIVLQEPYERLPSRKTLAQITACVMGATPVFLHLIEREDEPHVVVKWEDTSCATILCDNLGQAQRLHTKYRRHCAPGARVLVNGVPALTSAEMIRELRKALRRMNSLLMEIYNHSPRNSVAFNQFPRLNTINLSLLAVTKPQK